MGLPAGQDPRYTGRQTAAGHGVCRIRVARAGPVVADRRGRGARCADRARRLDLPPVVRPVARASDGDQQGEYGRATDLRDAGAAGCGGVCAVTRDTRCLRRAHARHHRCVRPVLRPDLHAARLGATRALRVTPTTVRQIPLGLRLPDRAVFASFLPARNSEAVEHARRLASGELAGITWMCGSGGAGKSHLLQAICAAASERMRAGYVPLAQVSGLGVGVLEGLPQLQCLCLDDIDQVAGQADWERGIFGVLREMEDAGGRLIASAQTPPALAPWTLADLGSRCAAGAVFQLRVLDESEQQAALQLRAGVRERRSPRSVPSLYEVLYPLDEAARAAQRRLTIPFIREVLRSAARSRG